MDIKKEVQLQYDAIKLAEQRLKELRVQCIHPSSSMVNYSWRVGSIELRKVCDDCGELMDNHRISGKDLIIVEQRERRTR